MLELRFAFGAPGIGGRCFRRLRGDFAPDATDVPDAADNPPLVYSSKSLSLSKAESSKKLPAPS